MRYLDIARQPEIVNGAQGGRSEESEISPLVARRDHLVARLEAGDAICAAAEAAGEDARGLNDHWERLLTEYMAVEDRLRREATRARLDGVGRCA